MFYIQDGRFTRSLTTHEAILTAATSTQTGIKYGAGIFAFATSGGISLVFEDEVLNNFMIDNRFTLIVGIDDITNTNALNTLRKLRERYSPNLDVKIFYHSDSGSLFHPKLIWFKIDEEIRLITGSGNLTEKGLRRNREAFTINNFSDSSLQGFEEYWNLWISENSNNLRELDDAEVINKAALNAIRFIRTRRLEDNLEEIVDENFPPEIGSDSSTTELDNEELDTTDEIYETEDYEAWSIEDNPEVLVAEIPKSDNRWKQANFNRAVFEGFFGGVAGGNEERRILLRHVGDTGALEELEVRPTVSVVSKNYRVELNSAGGLDYPAGEDRPIGIFIKVATRSFIYSLVMPGDINYNEVITYLNTSQPSVPGRMRRYLTDVEELRLNCPNLSFWLI